MADCCNQLEAEIAALRVEIAAIPRIDKHEIIQESIFGAQNVIVPLIGTAVYAAIQPVKQAVGAIDDSIYFLKGQVFNLGAKVENAAQSAANAARTAGSALGMSNSAIARTEALSGSVTRVLSVVIGLAASVAVLLALSSRMDTLEKRIDSDAQGLSNILSLLPPIKAKAESAYQEAKKGQDLADRAFIVATSANFGANAANKRAANAENLGNIAIAKSNEAKNVAQSASGKADTAIAVANNASNKANVATSIANSASDKADNAISKANSASKEANEASNRANNAINDAKEASSKANQAIDVANNAVNKANDVEREANKAENNAATANTKAIEAIRAAQLANDTALSASTKANTAIGTANTAIGISQKALSDANGAVNIANSTRGVANTALTIATQATGQISNLAGSVSKIGVTANESLHKSEEALNLALRIPVIFNSQAEKFANETADLYDKFLLESITNEKIAQGNSKLADEKFNQTLQQQNQQFENTINNKFAQQTQKIYDDFKTYSDNNAKIAQGDTKLASQVWEQTLKDTNDSWNNNFKQIQSSVNEVNTNVNNQQKIGETLQNNLDNQNKRINIVENKVNTLQSTVNNSNPLESRVKKLETNNVNLSQQIQQIQPTVQTLKTNQLQTNKVNQESNDKLDIFGAKIDQLFPAIAGIPLVIGRATNTITSQMPTQQELENASATGVCRTTKPGGCMANALNDNANTINGNTNKGLNDLFGKFSAGANAAQLGLLNVINNKLGIQVPGGISGFLGTFKNGFDKLAKRLGLDWIMSSITMVTSLHNAYMISDSVRVTLIQTFNDFYKVFGVKDENDNDLDIGKLYEQAFDEIFTSIFGEGSLDGIKKEWTAFNRIYQASANIMFALQNIGFSMLNAFNAVGSINTNIANALKKYGVVGHNAFPWFNPTPDFHNKFFTAISEKANEAVTIITSLDFIAQSILQGRQAIDDFAKQGEELDKKLKEEINKHTVPEHDPTKKINDKSTKDSKSPKPSDEEVAKVQE